MRIRQIRNASVAVATAVTIACVRPAPANTIRHSRPSRPCADDVCIQALIDAAAAHGGGTVQLDARTYYLAAEVSLRPGVSLCGAGKGKTTLELREGSRSRGILMPGFGVAAVRNLTIDLNRAATPDNRSDTNQQGIYAVSADGAVAQWAFEDLEIANGHRMGIAVSCATGSRCEFRIARVDVRNVQRVGILISGAAGFEIESTNVEACADEGMIAAGSHHWSIRRSAFVHNGWHGTVAGPDSSEFVIENSHFVGNGVNSDRPGSGIVATFGCTRFLIANNMVTDSGAHGIAIDVRRPSPREWEFAEVDGMLRGNTVDGAAGHGVYVQYARRVLVEENTVTNATLFGIFLIGRDLTAVRNSVSANRGGGIGYSEPEPKGRYPSGDIYLVANVFSDNGRAGDYATPSGVSGDIILNREPAWARDLRREIGAW